MTHHDHDPPRGRTITWPGVAAGLLGAPFTIFAVDRLMIGGEPYLLVPAGVVLLGVVVAKRRTPFWRGVGAGLLLAVAIGAIVVAGICLVLVATYQ